MSYLSIEGGAPLHGELTIQGSKNSVLPVLAATILARDVCRIENCPRLRDVDASVAILRHLGCRVRRDGTALEVDTAPMARCDIPDELMREMRSSIIFLGAILARQGEAVLSYPGGCELGPRPIDLHLAALRELGAEITAYYATEIDKYAVQTTQHNYPDTMQLGDAFQVRAEDWHLPEPEEMEAPANG